MSLKGRARRLRRRQTEEEAQLWSALRAARFSGFKFRRQHPLGGFFLDFYCPLARLAVELDGFQHGLLAPLRHDKAREELLAQEDVEVLRFWNHQWRDNRDGVLLAIWQALHRRTGCEAVIRKEANNRFLAPGIGMLTAGSIQTPARHPSP